MKQIRVSYSHSLPRKQASEKDLSNKHFIKEIFSHLNVESKQYNKRTDWWLPEMAVGAYEVGEEGQGAQTSSYRIKWSLGCHVTIVNNVVSHISKLLRVNIKSPHHKKKIL